MANSSASAGIGIQKGVWIALMAVLLIADFAGSFLCGEEIQTREFVLRDYFGADWPEQVIQKSIRFADGECHEDSLSLSESENLRIIPFQIHKVVKWPGSPFLKDCVLLWRSGIAKDSQKLWFLGYSRKPRNTAAHASPFKWKSTKHRLELSNNRIGIAFPPEGAVSKNVLKIPPLKKLRGPDGIWFGEGKWAAMNQNWEQVQVKKTADGPIFSEVTASYFFKGRVAYEVQFQLPGDEDYVLIHEFCRADLHAGGGWAFNLSHNFKPDRKRDFQYYQAQPPAPLAEEQGIIAHLRPWTFAQIFTHRDYLGIHQAEGRKDAVGLMAINGSEWRRGSGKPYWPEANFSSRDGWKLPDLDQAVQLVRDNKQDVVVRFPLCGGRRVTGIAVYDKSRDRGRYVLEDIRHKTSETPLSDVLRMVLDWNERTPRPYLYGDKKVFDKARKDYDPKSPQNRWVCEEFRALMTGDLSNAPKMRDAIVKAAKELASYWTFPQPFETEIDKSRVRTGYVGTGLRAIEVGPKARNLAGQYDLACALGILSDDDKRLVRAALAFAAYKFSDPEFFAPLCALGNFKVDGYFSLAVIALTFPNHPHSERWLAEAKRQIAEDLDQGIYIYESGAGNECEIYRAMSTNFLTQLAMLFKIHHMPELADHPRLREALKWFVEFSVPPVPKVSYGLPRVLPFDGDTTTTTPPVYGMFGMAAALYNESHPQLSKQFNWFWKQSKQTPFRGHGINNQGLLNRLYLRYDLPEEAPKPYVSRSVKGYGFVFHKNWGKPDEWMIFGKAGPGTGHYHASDGSIQIYANGKPLVIGYGKYPYMTTTWRYTTLRLDGRSNWSRGTTGPVFTSDLLDAAEMHVPVVNVSKHREKTLPQMVEAGQITDSTWDAVMDVPSSHFDRSVIYNRADNYIVVYDRSGPRYNSDWFTHVMSERHTVKGRLIQFTGRFGELDLHILAPAGASPIVQGPIATQYEREIQSKKLSWPKNNIDQQIVQLSGPPDSDYLTVFHPRKRDEEERPLRITKRGAVWQIESGTGTSRFVCVREPVQVKSGEFVFHGERGGVVNAGSAQTLLMLSGTKIGTGELKLETDRPVALLAEIREGRFKRIVTQASKETSLRIGQAEVRKVPAGRSVILPEKR